MASIEPRRQRKTRAAGLSCSGELTFRTGRKMDPIVSRVVAVRIESLGMLRLPGAGALYFRGRRNLLSTTGLRQLRQKANRGNSGLRQPECELEFFFAVEFEKSQARRQQQSIEVIQTRFPYLGGRCDFICLQKEDGEATKMGGKRVSGLEDDFVDGLPLPTDSGPPPPAQGKKRGPHVTDHRSWFGVFPEPGTLAVGGGREVFHVSKLAGGLSQQVLHFSVLPWLILRRQCTMRWTNKGLCCVWGPMQPGSHPKAQAVCNRRALVIMSRWLMSYDLSPLSGPSIRGARVSLPIYKDMTHESASAQRPSLFARRPIDTLLRPMIEEQFFFFDPVRTERQRGDQKKKGVSTKAGKESSEPKQ